MQGCQAGRGCWAVAVQELLPPLEAALGSSHKHHAQRVQPAGPNLLTGMRLTMSPLCLLQGLQGLLGPHLGCLLQLGAQRLAGPLLGRLLHLARQLPRQLLREAVQAVLDHIDVILQCACRQLLAVCGQALGLVLQEMLPCVLGRVLDLPDTPVWRPVQAMGSARGNS